MTTKLEAAARQAMEALDCIYSPLHVREIEKVGKAMSALRAAIEQTPGNPAEDGVCEALDCCKQQLEDARTEAVALRVNEQNLIAALEAEREAIAQFFEQHYRDRWTDVEIVEAIRARSAT